MSLMGENNSRGVAGEASPMSTSGRNGVVGVRGVGGRCGEIKRRAKGEFGVVGMFARGVRAWTAPQDHRGCGDLAL